MRHADNSKAATKDGSAGFSFAANASNGNCIQSILDITGNIEDTYFSLFNFDTCNLGALQEFQQPAFDDSDGSFSFLISGEKSDLQSGTNDID
ncbi:hypothetical protein Nepgr_023643 [Nepenthes gracilis]|uniref:Uncharacterized protein n=1 Tax=Nepenthes gracilis TaxID=150966 RepID=A0AAD3T1R7_NEPGR|nr:hypothetical protein Nepgr_023643 [Nepenthes gracilis]